MSEEIIKEKIPWHWIIPLIVILPALNAYAQYYYNWVVGHMYDLGAMGYVLDFNTIPGIIAVILIIAARFRTEFGKRLTNAQLAYIFTAVIICAIFAGKGQYYAYIEQLAGARYSDVYKLANHIPEFWVPSKSAVTTLMQGGPVSAEWVPSIIFWSLLNTAIWVCIAGFTIFLRHQWIDVEGLTFPYAQISVESINIIREPAGSKAKKYLIGALIGFVFYIPATFRQFFKWFPDIYGWFNPVVNDSTYIATLRPMNVWPSLYRSVVGMTQLTYNPFFIALAYLAPMDTLLSASFFYIVIILIGAQIAFTMGYYTGMDVASDGSRSTMMRLQPPIILTSFSEHGILIALMVMPILLNWRSVILRPLKAALGKGTAQDKELERTEPVSYRTALIMVIASSAFIVSMLVASGFVVDDALLYWVMAVIFILSYLRIRGHALFIPVGAYIGPLFIRWKYSYVTMANVPRSYYLFGVSASFSTCGPTPFYNSNLYTFDIWKMGNSLKVDLRSLFMIAGVTAIVAPLVGYSTMVMTFGTLGALKAGRIPWDPSTRGTPMWINTSPMHPAWPWITAGFLLAAFLTFMHYRFVWWPLEPVGAFLATGGPGVKVGLGFVFIIAYIIKYITLKVGGSKAYTETGVPIAVGFAVGTGLQAIIGMALGVITFVRPL